MVCATKENHHLDVEDYTHFFFSSVLDGYFLLFYMHEGTVL